VAEPTLISATSIPREVGPRNRREAWGWLLVAAAGFVAGQAIALALGAIGASIAGTPGGVAALAKLGVPPVWFIVVELLGLWCGFGGAAWVVTRNDHHVGLWFRPTDAWFVFAGVGLQILLAVLYAPLHLRGLSKPTHHLLGAGSGWLLVLPGVMVVVFAPIFEELFFRGVLLRSFLSLMATPARVLGIALAVLCDGALFGLAHLGNDTWYQLPGLVLTGMVLAGLAVWSGRLGPSIVTHASFNALAVLAFAVQR
jgi:membrane protease YdiL (CAAX protease family)